MGLFKDYVNQTRKPEGFLGKLMLSGMNYGHAKLTDWGFTHLPAEALTPGRWDSGNRRNHGSECPISCRNIRWKTGTGWWTTTPRAVSGLPSRTGRRSKHDHRLLQ